MPAYLDDASADAVEVPIKIVNGLGTSFEARSLCLSVDGQRVGTTDAGELGAGLRNRRPLEPHVRLSPGREHVVLLNALYAGTGQFDGYYFQITSERAIAPTELRAETITASINEVTAEGQRTPLEQRPQVEWSGPGHSSRNVRR